MWENQILQAFVISELMIKLNVEYDRNNNFYYIPNESFQVPTSDTYKPLNGEQNPLIDGNFYEKPAKWTGNGSRQAKPDINDWYETVKVNYGVKPDGTKDFPTLPEGFDKKSFQEHYAFWKGKDVPNSWQKIPRYRFILDGQRHRWFPL